MGDNNSGGGFQFGFGKPNTAETKQIDSNTSPVEEDTLANTNKIIANDEVTDTNEDLDSEYTDERSITINLVKNYSLYRKANDKVLPKRQDFIGGSVSASRILSSNKAEIETYFPNLIGLTPGNVDFVMRVKQYLNNIRIAVDELGKTFNTSFIYNKKRDYYKIKAKEQAIDDIYQKVDRQNITKLKAALADKITRLNVLESEKYALGRPVDVEDYLMYRHCLLYNDVAKDVALINSDNNIRFYIKDDKKEAEKLRKHRIEINKAKVNYVSTLADHSLFEAVYVQFLHQANQPIIPGLLEDSFDKELKLDKFSADEPAKFNKIVSNKDVKLIGTIELLIARNILQRSNYNQNISTDDGTFIGANMNEAIIWFKNPDNTSIVNSYYTRLKNI